MYSQNLYKLEIVSGKLKLRLISTSFKLTAGPIIEFIRVMNMQVYKALLVMCISSFCTCAHHFQMVYLRSS